MTPNDRARALLRHLDHEVQRAEEEYTTARQQAAESVVRRRERFSCIQGMQYAEVVKALAEVNIYRGFPELAKRDDDVDARWEQALAEVRWKQVRAASEYEGARRMAVEAELIGFDERPRWIAPAQRG